MSTLPAAEAVDFHVHPGARRATLLLCDHAGNDIPVEFGDLGLTDGQRRLHVAWDPGAAGVTRALAALIDCPAFFGHWSRLVVDLNRAPDAGDLIVYENDGVAVPGNLRIDATERARRVDRYHRPYHDAIDRYLDGFAEGQAAPALISVHTFTPSAYGVDRPWHAGVLWQQRQPWVPGLIAGLAEGGLVIGDNEPYDGRAALGHSLERHALPRGLRHVLIEVRQDLVAETPQQVAWAGRLHRALRSSGFLG